MRDGGYDIGYKACPNFWGDNPGSLILKLEELNLKYKNLKVLDLGCGEGKNAIYLAKKGCYVDAFEISEFAISNAKKKIDKSLKINIQQCDVLNLNLAPNSYNVIISYGLFHCFESKAQVNILINNCLNSLKREGYLILCAFNSREQDLSAHPGFKPLLIDHQDYLKYFNNHNIIFETDEDLYETHPHNKIPHVHSLTRLIIQKK